MSEPTSGRTLSVEVEVLTDLAPLRFTLTRDEASRLYNDVTVALRALDVDFAGNRKNVDIPALYALYDALYAAGVS